MPCLYTAAQTRELDRIAIEECGIPGYTLMCRAGQAVFDLLRERWPRCRRPLIFCGPGNNGGDGYVVARLARQAGMEPVLIRVGDHTRLRGDARRAEEDFRAVGGGSIGFRADEPPGGDLVIDAMLGTGLERPLGGEFRAAVEWINASGLPVLAVDIPTGLNADTGAVMGVAVEADATLSFIGRKRGLYTGAGPDYCGRPGFARLEVSDEVYRQVRAGCRLLESAEVRQALPARKRSAHKGDFGHVLVVGGDLGMSGAARMAAEAAARVGAGLVSIATRQIHAAVLCAARPEIMCHGVEDRVALNPLLRRASVVVLGPGLGQGEWGRSMVAGIVDSGRPLVVDADALNLLAAEHQARDNWILTPHPGEAARLLGTDSATVQSDRFAAVAELHRRYGGVVVLKGAGSLIHDGAETFLCHAGNPGMASGGMGDVLSGVIGGLLAQGLEPVVAARVGVQVHAEAADRVATDGERGMLAGDLLPWLRKLVNPD